VREYRDVERRHVHIEELRDDHHHRHAQQRRKGAEEHCEEVREEGQEEGGEIEHEGRREAQPIGSVAVPAEVDAEEDRACLPPKKAQQSDSNPLAGVGADKDAAGPAVDPSDGADR
jgi:hypothetical protein